MEPLILASSSPRRREILTLLDLPFEAIPAQTERAIDLRLPLNQAVMQVARGKAEEIAALYPRRIVLGADTVVAVDGQVLGKPRGENEAFEMLRRLQGRRHKVYTGVWVCGSARPKGGFTDTAEVEFLSIIHISEPTRRN